MQHAGDTDDSGCPGKFQTSLTCSLPKTEGREHHPREAGAKQLGGGALMPGVSRGTAFGLSCASSVGLPFSCLCSK
jgi:hypothetical protein